MDPFAAFANAIDSAFDWFSNTAENAIDDVVKPFDELDAWLDHEIEEGVGPAGLFAMIVLAGSGAGGALGDYSEAKLNGILDYLRNAANNKLTKGMQFLNQVLTNPKSVYNEVVNIIDVALEDAADTLQDRLKIGFDDMIEELNPLDKTIGTVGTELSEGLEGASGEIGFMLANLLIPQEG